MLSLSFCSGGSLSLPAPFLCLALLLLLSPLRLALALLCLPLLPLGFPGLRRPITAGVILWIPLIMP